MKTKYQYIHFKEIEDLAGRNISGQKLQWACLNNRSKDILGLVEYYSTWKQHAIDFKETCVFNAQCLRDIVDFLTQLNCQKKGKNE